MRNAVRVPVLRSPRRGSDAMHCGTSLAARVVGDPTEATDVDRAAAAICGPQADPLEREQALIVAEAQVILKRVRRVRAQLMEQMSQVPPTQDLDAPDTTSTSVVDLSAPYIDQLLRLERYERRALSRRKRAVRVASS